MHRFLLELDLYRKLAAPLARPHQVASWGQLARLTRVGDDKARRCIERLKECFNTDLVVSKDHRLVLTGAGKKALQVADQLTALAEDMEGETPEVLTVQIEPFLVQSLLPRALPDFFEVWSYVQLRVCPLDSGSVRQHIAEGVTAFGVGIAEDTEAIPSAEVLGPPIPLILLSPRTHRLGGHLQPVTAEELRGDDRVFVSRQLLALPGVETFLDAVPQSRRTECEAAHEMVAAGLGLGVSLDLPRDVGCESLNKRVIEAPPVQLRFYLPKRGEATLTEPQQSLVTGIRRAAETTRKAEMAPEITEEPVNGSPPEISLWAELDAAKVDSASVTEPCQM